MEKITKKGRTKFYGIIVVMLLLGAVQAEKGIFSKRLVFWPRGWQTEKDMTENVQIMDRAAAAGYNGLIVASPKFPQMHRFSRNNSFFTNFKAIQAHAKKKGLGLCPNYAYQTIPSHHSLTGAEAFPVRGTPFVVNEDLQAVVMTDSALSIANSGFDGTEGEFPSGWRTIGLTPGNQVFVDNQVRQGNSAVCFQNLTDNSGACLYQTINVKAFRAYEIGAWIKTDGFVNKEPANPRRHGYPARLVQIAVFGSNWNHWVNHVDGGTAWPKQALLTANQNWRRFRIVFCSMANTRLKILIKPVGYHCFPAGKIWFDDINIREVGLIETVIRSTTPVIVRSAVDPSVVYKEGTDFRIDAETDYMAQGKITIPSSSAIKSGDRLSVDWNILGDQEQNMPSGAWCDGQAFQYLIDDNLLIHEMTGGLRSYHIAIGEWRDAGWDPVCTGLYGNAGAYIAGATLGLEATCRLFNSKMDIYIKNDMYDPYHNAGPGVKQYYLCRGSVAGAWEGITDSAIVMNWRPNVGEVGSPSNLQIKSLLFWAGLDPNIKIKHHRQIIRFNCQSGTLYGVDKVLQNIGAAEGMGLTGMVGCVYNTWDPRYASYAGMEEMAQLCKDDGRWGTNLCPFDNGCDYEITLDSSKLVPPPLGIDDHRSALGTAGESIGLKHCYVNGTGVKIHYSIPACDQVKVSMVNILGRKSARSVTRRKVSAGEHAIRLRTNHLSSGVYFVVLEARDRDKGENSRAVRKITIL